MTLSYKDRITQKVNVAFAPCQITLADESYKHAGHAGADPAGETHFALTVVSDTFGTMSRVQRHQVVYEVLKEELDERVHALRLKTLTLKESDSSR